MQTGVNYAQACDTGHKTAKKNFLIFRFASDFFNKREKKRVLSIH